MLDRGLKTLVISTALIPSLSIALLLGVYLSISRLQDIDELVNTRGVAAVTQLAVAVRPTLHDRPTLQQLTEMALEERGVRAVSIYGADGRVLAHAGPHLHEPLAQQPASLTHRTFDNIEQFIQPILPTTQFTTGLNLDVVSASSGSTSGSMPQTAPEGWIALEYSHQYQTLSRYHSLMIGILIISLAVIAAATLAAYTSRRFGVAMARLREGIAHIEQGRFNQPINFENDHLLQHLANDINRMATHVHSAHVELQRSLEQTNRDLRESLDTVEVQNIELDLARREALEASRIKSEFLANTSHELRTPLNGIIGFTKLLLKSTLEIRQRDYLETVRHSAESLLSIINDILDFSKIEAGKLVIDSMPFSLRDLIEDTLAILAPSAQEKNLKFTLDYAAEVPADMVGDPLRLRQILLNLIGNAIKFTAQGSVTVRVHLSSAIVDGRAPLQIHVSDTGIGLSDMQLRQMFKPFAQADASTSRLFGGTGLGLVISKKLIEQMGGEIGVESIVGEGSTFRISLRLQTLEKSAAVKSIAGKTANNKLSANDTAPAIARPNLQVLAVDDNPTNLRLLALLLEEQGITTHLASGGQEALTLANTQRFDLILLDIQMPDIDGRAVAEQLRNTANPNRNTRLAALTAHVLPEEQRNLLALGFDQCLTKPITEEQLAALLNSAETSASDAPPRPVDVALCLHRARQKPDLARDMLEGVLESLGAMRAQLLMQPEQHDVAALLSAVHKLHGACCYTGTPRLQQCTLALEEQLKRNGHQPAFFAAASVKESIADLISAIDELVSWRERHDIDVLFDLECNN
jgi:signal transduction histidine kinase/CheY-like chemotaxis protein